MGRLRQRFLLILISVIGILFLGQRESLAEHLACSDPIRGEGIGWCSDPTSNHFLGGLCIAEPVGQNRAIQGDPTEILEAEELTSSDLCVLGKIAPDRLDDLVDFTVSLDFLPSNQFEALLEVDSGLFAPEVDLFLAPTGEATTQGGFQQILLLPREGQYNLKVQAWFIEDGPVPVTAIKRVIRLSTPHLTVADAQGNVTGQTQPVTGYSVAEQAVEDDGGMMGEEGPVSHSVSVTPPSGAPGTNAIDLCLESDQPEATDHPSHPGSALEFSATNRIRQGTGDQVREMTISCHSGDGICNVASGGAFCSDGNIVSIPMGHGTNEIEMTVNNVVTGNDPSAGERIVLAPIQNDLEGPSLCVSYLNGSGVPIVRASDVDGTILRPADAVTTLDVTLGACEGSPEAVMTGSACPGPEDSGIHPVCMETFPGVFEPLTAGTGADGKIHYQAPLIGGFRFPINTVTLKAVDDAGNETRVTHSFLFGDVRSIFNAAGELDVSQAVVPKGVGGFIDDEYLTGEIKPLLLKVLNSDKFKNEMFPKLLDPRQPGLEEQQCLQALEPLLGSTFDHLGDFDHMGNADRVVALKLFCDGGECGEIGDIEIPNLYLLSDNKLRLQLKINGLRGRAEMYTLQFVNTDAPLPNGDTLVDTEDDDDDADGILDEDDPDDDNDGVPDERDLPGRLTEDPDYGTFVLPVRFAVKELAVNMDLSIEKVDGKIQLQIANAPDRKLVEAIPDDEFLIEFDCDKDISELYQGGDENDPGNGRHLWIDSEACRALASLNANLGRIRNDPAQNFFAEDLVGIDFTKRKFQGTNDQFRFTFEATLRCSTPERLEVELEKLDTKKVTAISQKLFDKKFHFDFFAPLGRADLFIDPVGVGFSGGGVLLSAGVTDEDFEGERDAKEFLESLPPELKNRKFGPVYGVEVPEGDRADPIEASYGMGSEVGLALKEETVNSLLHAINVTLFDLNRQENDDLKTLDLFAKRLREEFEMGIPDVAGTICRDQNNQRLDEFQVDEETGLEIGDGGIASNWKCFPFPLSLSVLLGGNTIRYKDFDGNGVVEPETDSQIPVFLRTTLNNFAAPTARLVNVSAIEAWDGSGATRPDLILAELEVALPPTEMAIYEERWQQTAFVNPNTGNAETVRRGSGEIKSWCDDDRFPGMDPGRCGSEPRRNAPIVVFEATGRIFLTLLIDRRDNGIMRIAAGVSSKETATGPTMDEDKSFLKVSVVENNTIVPDKPLGETFEGNMKAILGYFLFGSGRTIKIEVPAMAPLFHDEKHPELKAFCDKYPDEIPEVCDCEDNPEDPDCEQISAIQDLWEDLDLDEDFGIGGFELQDPLIGIAGSGVSGGEMGEAVESLMSGPRYLTVGIGTCVKDADGNCVKEEKQE